VIVSGGFDHASVLVDEVVHYLNVCPGKLYCDGTTGGGGHLEAILRVPETRAIGVDRDQTALQAAETRLLSFSGRVRLVSERFSELPRVLRELDVAQVDGIVLDLGVSSPQLDVAERGFSFTKAGPLDMRMDPNHGQTALELIESLDADELGEVISEFGEERHARKIARLIKDAARANELRTTIDLADVVARAIPSAEQRMAKIHPATRTFQALRIAVNQELDELAAFLAAFPDMLAPGGRCVVISFHSLEDRLVKNAFRDLAWTTSLPDKLAREAGERIAPVVDVLTKKPVMAGDAELARNPRARSAKLRACERTTAPVTPARARGTF
jgi:16S rRNA (cytosine1402-N4)-methyltransferase